MFVERLTEEQVKQFVENIYWDGFKVSVRETTNSETSIYVENTKSSNDCGFTITLEDFGVRGLPSRLTWVRYLYKIFGEEYKEAYLANCAKVFE